MPDMQQLITTGDSLNKNLFDIGKWHGALIFKSENFREFKAYLESEKSLNSHLSDYTMFSIDESGDKKHYQLSQGMLNKYKESISDSLRLHANMMIVTAGAYYENIVFDFLQNYFTHKPDSLHKYIGSESNLGHIKITEAFSYDTLSGLINALASRGAKNASAGTPDTVISRIKTLTKRSISARLEARVTELVVRRNAIAHDIKEYSLEQVDVHGAYETLMEFLKELGSITHSLGLPLYDPGNLLDLGQPHS